MVSVSTKKSQADFELVMASLDGLSLFYRQQILDHLLRVEPRLELLLKSYYDEKLEKEKKYLEDTVFAELKQSYEYSLDILQNSNDKLTNQLDTINDSFNKRLQIVKDKHADDIDKILTDFGNQLAKKDEQYDTILQVTKEHKQVQDTLNHEILSLKAIVQNQAKSIRHYQEKKVESIEKDKTIQAQNNRIKYLESLLGVDSDE